MKKPYILWGLIVLFTCSILLESIDSYANNDPIRVIIDGELQKFNQNPMIINGTTLVPMRAIFEVLGADVTWNDGIITAVKDNMTIILKIGSKSGMKNGDIIELVQPPQLINGSTYVPLRFVSEALGATVNWEASSRSVYIESEEPVNIADVAKEIHINAWIETAKLGQNNPQYKYAIYQSRTLAVKHPEVYLQADELFNQFLTKESNTWNYYLDRTQNIIQQDTNYRKISESAGEVFSWSKFNISKHKKIEQGDIYNNIAFLPYIDLRLHFMGSALKGSDWNATSLSMGEFLYFQNKDTGKKPYLLIASDGTTYVSPNDEVILQDNGKELSSIDKDIILIFNEDFVWYPLMDRDDRQKDSRLNKLVDTYSTSNFIPSLTKEEEEVIDYLRIATSLTGEKDKSWALAFAGKLHSTTWKRYSDLNKIIYPEDAKNAGFNRSHGPEAQVYINAYIARLSNHINPGAAQLAAIARVNQGQDNLDEMMERVTSKYLDYIETNTRPRTGNLQLWSHSEQFYLNMDDNFLSKASNCIMSATNTAAILDLADIEGLEFYVLGFNYTDQLGGHAYIGVFYNDKYGTIENYKWANQFNGLQDGRSGLVLKAIVTKEGWIVLDENKDFKAPLIRYSLSSSEIKDLLNDLLSFGPKTNVSNMIDRNNVKGIPLLKYLDNIPDSTKWEFN